MSLIVNTAVLSLKKSRGRQVKTTHLWAEGTWSLRYIHQNIAACGIHSAAPGGISLYHDVPPACCQIMPADLGLFFNNCLKVCFYAAELGIN